MGELGHKADIKIERIQIKDLVHLVVRLSFIFEYILMCYFPFSFLVCFIGSIWSSFCSNPRNS